MVYAYNFALFLLALSIHPNSGFRRFWQRYKKPNSSHHMYTHRVNTRANEYLALTPASLSILEGLYSDSRYALSHM